LAVPVPAILGLLAVPDLRSDRRDGNPNDRRFAPGSKGLKTDEFSSSGLILRRWWRDEGLEAMSKPLCIDLFCGLGGWTEGFLSEGWDVVGFDIERHQYGDQRYPAQLVLQDVLTLHGSQFRNIEIKCVQHSLCCRLDAAGSHTVMSQCNATTGQAAIVGINTPGEDYDYVLCVYDNNPNTGEQFQPADFATTWLGPTITA
jgi:hypothetical protein